VARRAILKRQGVISVWHDRRIGAGADWAGEISEHLESAQVILLLVSASFLASDYCYDVELKRALERHGRREARVIPVILQPVDWHEAEFGHLQALPKDAKPVTAWKNRDEAFTNVSVGIRNAAIKLIDNKEHVRTNEREQFDDKIYKNQSTLKMNENQSTILLRLRLKG
jgi:hypothetical protein